MVFVSETALDERALFLKNAPLQLHKSSYNQIDHKYQEDVKSLQL